jgi:hypothetical protein
MGSKNLYEQRTIAAYIDYVANSRKS